LQAKVFFDVMLQTSIRQACLHREKTVRWTRFYRISRRWMKVEVSWSWLLVLSEVLGTNSFICQGTYTRRQRRDLFGLKESSCHLLQGRGNPVKYLGLSSHYPLNTEVIPTFTNNLVRLDEKIEPRSKAKFRYSFICQGTL